MPKFFVESNQINEDEIVIQNDDVNHIKNVLRAKIGDNLDICNYMTSENYNCKIDEINDKYIKCKIIDRVNSNVESKVKVSIFQGLPKADKMELIIQKSVELGAYDITPVEMKRCVVKLNDKEKQKKVQRWQKISEVAAKQSGRNIIPKINDIVNVNQLCEKFKEYDLVLVAYEKEKLDTLKKELQKIDKSQNNIKIAIIIGPEGGIEEKEIELFKENKAKIITLGSRILRTETVALNMISIITYELDS